VGESIYDAKNVAPLHWMVKVGSLGDSASLTLWKNAFSASFVRLCVGFKVGLDVVEKGNVAFYAGNKTSLL
jgi:hypothetical protein